MVTVELNEFMPQKVHISKEVLESLVSKGLSERKIAEELRLCSFNNS